MADKPLFPPVFAPNVSHPMVDDFTARASRQRARAHPSLPMMQPVPLRDHPMWQGNSELGQEVPFAPDDNNRQTVLKMETWGPPEIWTVSLGLAVPEEDLTNNGWDTTALIQFGGGGNVQQVEIDWLNGASISLPANAITVNARYDFTISEGGDGPPNSLRLQAMVARNNLSAALPTRTIRARENETAFRIPPYAKNVSLIPFVSFPGITPYGLYSSGNYLLLMTTSSSVAAAFEISQFVSYLDAVNNVVGAPMKIQLPSFIRYVAIGDLTATPIDASGIGVYGFQFDIGV